MPEQVRAQSWRALGDIKSEIGQLNGNVQQMYSKLDGLSTEGLSGVDQVRAQRKRLVLQCSDLENELQRLAMEVTSNFSFIAMGWLT